jgi:TnpA family transposase
LSTDQPTRAGNSRRLTVLSQAERLALYGLPDFDAFQRAEYFAFTGPERALAERRKGFAARLHCMLQIGYFKAKNAFFSLPAQEVPAEDLAFLVERYFPGNPMALRPVTAYEQYAQRTEIAKLFGYRLWSGTDHPALVEAAARLARRDVTPAFVLIEVLAFLNARKIVRPGYTTLQTIIGDALTAERQRLEQLIENGLDADTNAALRNLLVREDTLSELAALKQDAKNFGYRMMTVERQKRTTLAPMHHAAKDLLPRFGISQQNIEYYASLVHYYTIYDLRRMRPAQSHLYLLCYAWQRYRQLSDNLVEAFDHQLRQIQQQTKEASEAAYVLAQAKRQQEAPRVGRVLLLYVDEAVEDVTPFGAVRSQAFAILPREALLTAGKRLCEKPVSQLELRWQAIDRAAARFKQNLRPLAMALEFSAEPATSPWHAALCWMRDVFSREQRLSQRPVAEIPQDTIPKKLRQHLFNLDATGDPTGLRGDRYEFWIYRQVSKRLATGELAVDDSLRHRRFSDELVEPHRQAEILKDLDIPWLRQPVEAGLDVLCADLDRRWQTFERELRRGKLKHLDYDPQRKTLSLRRPKADREDEALEDAFYGKLAAQGIADVFHFVNAQCGFLSALPPLQPRYAKRIADDDSLTAAIIARAIGHGNLRMAETCDIPYHVLEATDRQHIRLATLRDACDRISNFIADLSIFPLYSFDPEILYGSVDGQKFASAEPTIKARYSRKYFGKGKGVVAYTLLANHVPLETELIGANEHESHYVFDICYHNTSDIVPTTITGDMHSVNKANFAVLHWFGLKFAPRFTSLQAQLPHLYCASDIPQYASYLLSPTGQIDRCMIAAGKENIDRIVATLGLKEMSQSTLVRKLCALPQHNSTRKAVFEFDKLIRSIYTLDYLRDPQLQRDVHRSQNRIEAYHQLRAAIAQVGGKKQLIGATDLDVAITNQCGRLTASVIIAYNTILLSALLERYRATDDKKALMLLRKISPVAWQHVHFLGRYLFRGNRQPIDLVALLADVAL